MEIAVKENKKQAGGLKTSPIGLGCMGLAAFYGAPLPQNKVEALLAETLKAGITHFDTAEIYRSDFPKPATETSVWNETQIGVYLSKIKDRASFTVATKYMPFLHGGDAATPASIEEAVDASLKRLGLEYIDLYYCHRMPGSWEALRTWMQTMKSLVEKKKIIHVGLSEVSPNWLRKAHAIHPITAIQQEWSLLTRTPIENALVPVCKELGVTVVAYSPLARNLLGQIITEPPKDWRATNPRYSSESLAKNAKILKSINKMASSKGLSMSQLSLGWLYAKAKSLGITVLPIPGTTKVDHALENLGALKADLSGEEMATLEAAAAEIAGARGDEGYLKSGADGGIARDEAAKL